jgi:hypothetical protein
MKAIALIAPALVLAGFAAAAPAQRLTKNETTHQTLHFAGAGPHVLEIRTVEGSISIEGYDGADVDMTVNKSISARTDDGLQHALSDVVLETADNAATVGAVARYPNGDSCGEESHSHSRDWPDYEVRYDFTIRVPRDTRLKVCTINRGDVKVKGTRENFRISSINGRIDLIDMNGAGDATTINGGISASFVVAPRADSLFKTINGDIVLTVPDPFSADLDMKTFTGGLFTDFVAAPRAVKAAVQSHREGTQFVYEANPFANVRIGNGGPLLTFETLNGDVRVLRRAR